MTFNLNDNRLVFYSGTILIDVVEHSIRFCCTEGSDKGSAVVYTLRTYFQSASLEVERKVAKRKRERKEKRKNNRSRRIEREK